MNPSEKSNGSIEVAWRQYRKTGDEDARNVLLEHYLPLVKYNAERIHTRLPDEVEVDDLMSAGIFGLMDAIDAFDEHRGVKFETYCAPRIRGAILDELRSMDWVPRLVRSRSSQVDTVRRHLQAELGRTPTEDEIAQWMNLGVDEYAKIRKDADVVGIVSLSRKWFETETGRDVCEVDVCADGTQLDPLRIVTKKDLKELVTKGLSREERLIIILYYYEEMTMREIGKTLDLSESRVSQKHASILLRLKARLPPNAFVLDLR